MALKAFYHHVDITAGQLLKNQKVSCRKGCCWCCYEPVYTEKREVAYMLEGLTPEQRTVVAERTRDWLEKTKELRNIENPNSLKWRGVEAPCPFLENNLCMIYHRRPFGCRTFFALGLAENCRMPQRKEQLFVQFSEGAMALMSCGYFTKAEENVLDHLGVFLAEKLLGIAKPSATRQSYKLPDDAELEARVVGENVEFHIHRDTKGLDGGWDGNGKDVDTLVERIMKRSMTTGTSPVACE